MTKHKFLQCSISPVSASISGATYVGVPHTVKTGSVTTMANPKSASFRLILPLLCRWTLKYIWERFFLKCLTNDLKLETIFIKVHLLIPHEKIFRLDVSVCDALVMDVLQSLADVLNHPGCTRFAEFSTLGNSIKQITTSHQLH